MPFKPSYGNPTLWASRRWCRPSNRPLKTLGEAMLQDVWFILCLGMINTPPLLPMCVRMQMCEASEAKAKCAGRQIYAALRSLCRNHRNSPKTRGSLDILDQPRFSGRKNVLVICLTCHVTVRWLKRMDKIHPNPAKMLEIPWHITAFVICRLFIYSV